MVGRRAASSRLTRALWATSREPSPVRARRAGRGRLLVTMGALRLLGVGLMLCVGCVAAPPTAEELLALGDPPPCGLISETMPVGETDECWRVVAPEGVLVTATSQVDSCEAHDSATSCVVLPAGATEFRSWFEPLSTAEVSTAVEPVPCDATCS